MVGDRWTDIEAGRVAGCKTILINNSPLDNDRAKPDFHATSLRQAVEWILNPDGRPRAKSPEAFSPSNFHTLRRNRNHD
jgi:predicted HAD superfamily phosphohydrolase YqeG